MSRVYAEKSNKRSSDRLGIKKGHEELTMTPERQTNTVTEKRTERFAEMTRTSDDYFDLVSTLYHSLKGAKTYACYAQDARAAGDEELAKFFDQCQQQSLGKVEKAKQLLATRAP